MFCERGQAPLVLEPPGISGGDTPAPAYSHPDTSVLAVPLYFHPGGIPI